MSEEPRPTDPLALAIDVILRTFSWAFLPIIVCAGLSIAVASGRTFPIRVGAPPDPLAFPVPARESAAAPRPSQPLLLASTLRDPVLEDLQDFSSPSRSLSLPKAERDREAALQILEDERLERCRSTSPFSFDQCFFFGSMDAAESRRAMEGGGMLRATDKPTGPPPESRRPAIPTW
jgi:hypothetical protein